MPPSITLLITLYATTAASSYHAPVRKCIPRTIPYLLFGLLVSPCFHKKLRSCGVAMFRGNHQRCKAILCIETEEGTQTHTNHAQS